MEGVDADDILEADVADFGSFNVKDGVLTFKAPPDFESKVQADGTTADPYKVVVQASDGGLTEWVEYFKVTVEILDQEEEGKVTWTVDTRRPLWGNPLSLLEFQAGAELTATVTDLDTVLAPVAFPVIQRHVGVVQVGEQQGAMEKDSFRQ